MNIRLRELTEGELEGARRDRQPLIRMTNCHREIFAVLEYQYGEGSAEGPSWTPVEVV